MKKILLLPIIILIVMALGACVPTATLRDNTLMGNDIDDLKEEVIRLESEMDILNEKYLEMQVLLESIGVIEGLNGQVEYYTNITGLTYLSYVELTDTEKDFMDKSKLPDYLFDINGEFVDQDDLALLLKTKYYGEEQHASDELQFVSNGVMLLWLETTMSNEEFMARTVLMIEELRNYDFYIIGNEDILFRIFHNAECIDIKIKVQTMRTDGIILSPQVIYDEMFFVTISGIEYDNELVQFIYDQYVLEETFSGYVLDYK